MKGMLKFSVCVYFVANFGVATILFADSLGKFCVLPTSAPIVGNPQPTTGTVRALFIFVKFSDDTFENGCTGQWNHATYNTTRPPWTNQLVDSAIMPNQTPHSLSDYFDVVSYGQFQMIGDVYPSNNMVYVPPHSESYYVRNTNYPSGNPLRRGIGYLNSEILKDLDSIIDYQQYDTNPNDNILDMVFIMYRKYDISTSGNCVGSYTGIAKLDPCDDGFFPLTLDGVEIRSGEFGSGATLRHALQLHEARDVVAHEYGHFWFGYTHFNENLGAFGYSDAGPAGNGAFDKVKLGWATPTIISVDTYGLTINDLATYGNSLFKILIPGNRSFLLENRQRTSLYEQQYTRSCGNLVGLPATGLLITEIGPGSSYPHSSIQDYPYDIREADNSWLFPGDAGDTYKPGNKVQFTPWTRPSSDYGSTNTGRAVTNIQQSGNQVIADIILNFSSGVLTENSWWEGSESITGNVTVTPGATLTISPGANVTISSGAVVTIQGTLSIASNVTISGGGTIVTSGSGKIYVTSSTDATAYNNSRKLVRDSAGNYHLVFESDGEICYEKWSNSGTALSEFRRLSSGTGSNKFPSIAERSGKFYVFWQRKTGTNTYDTHFRHFTGTSWDNIRNINTGIASNNDLTPVLAVSTPAASFEMMVVYRTNQGLRSRRSTSSTGASWDAAITVTSNTSARNPSLIYWQDPDVPSLKFHVTWDDGSNVKHQTFNGSTWGAELTLSSVPMMSNHQYSSYAVTGNADRHIVWQALESEAFNRQVIYHNKNLTNISTVLGSISWDHLRPGVTGHTGGAATVVCHETSANKNIRKRRYNGTSWEGTNSGTVVASNGADASVSIANPPGATALAVWRSAGSVPYALSVGPSGGLSKENANETLAYYRRIIFSLNNSSTLALQMGTVQLISAANKTEQAFPVVSDQDSIKINDLVAALKLSNLFLPSDVDSLVFEVEVYGQNAGDLRSDQSKSLDLAFDLLSVETGLPLASIRLVPLNNTGVSRQSARLVFPMQALRGRQIHLTPAASNLKLAKVDGALVHIYEVVEDGAQKARTEIPTLVAAAQPTLFSVRVYPNPFNPATQIYFYLPSEGVVAVLVYNVNGRVVKELSNGFCKAGEHVVTWNGRDELGKTVASGMYFSQVSFGEERKVAKMMLVR